MILEPETEQKLLRMSRAQIDRLLRPHRQRLKIKKTQRRYWAFTEDGRSRMS
ncbi:MAG: hypothetical protein ABIN54_02760 [candidate division WOR-3 bacterium]